MKSLIFFLVNGILFHSLCVFEKASRQDDRLCCDSMTAKVDHSFERVLWAAEKAESAFLYEPKKC
jgi:hypothetical protein